MLAKRRNRGGSLFSQTVCIFTLPFSKPVCCKYGIGATLFDADIDNKRRQKLSQDTIALQQQLAAIADDELVDPGKNDIGFDISEGP